MSAPDWTKVTIFTTQTPLLAVTAILGTDVPTVTAGYGGWTVIQRPRRLSFTKWTGRDPLRMVLGIMFDDNANDGSVEDACWRLEQMAVQPASRVPPPTVKVSGPVPHTDETYVIEGIEWGDSIRKVGPNRTFRTRQEFTVTLLRYVAEDKVGERAAVRARVPKKKTTKATPGGGTYKVKKGDTLQTIAAKQLGDVSRWREIAKLNNIRDPRKIKVGQTLKLPKRG